MDVLNMGILLDILDEEWMRDTLPNDDVSFPLEMTTRTDDAEDATNQENQAYEGETWRDLALDTHQ